MAKAASGEENECLFKKIVGAKFKPTDTIILDHYLAGKVCGRTEGPIFQFIKEIHLYQCEPEHLSCYGPYDFGDNPRKSYFFTVLKMIKTENGRNVDRSVAGGVGSWKKTGEVIGVEDEDETIIGTKTSLAYHTNGRKTNWLMTEYRLGDKMYEMLEKEYKIVEKKNKRLALCVVYLNGKKRGKCESENEVGNENVDHQSSKPSMVTSAGYSSLPVPDPNPDFPRRGFLPEENKPMSSNMNLGDASWSYKITIPDSHQNMPIAGMRYNCQSGAEEPIMNTQNFEPASGPWSSLSTTHNSYLTCLENLIISSAKNPRIASGSTFLLDSSSNLDDTLESFLPEDNNAMSSNENLGNASWSYNITIPDSLENKPISGMGYNSQSGTEEPIMNSSNFESASALWSSFSTAHNSCLSCPKLSISSANNPSIASSSSFLFNLSSNGDDTLQILDPNYFLTPSHWNSDKQEHPLEGYSQHDQATASIAQIPNGQNDPVMGNSYGENLNHNILTSSHENLNHNLQQRLAFQM